MSEPQNRDTTKMAIILNIEASQGACSVALSEDGGILFEKTSNEERSHTRVLAPFVEEAIVYADERGYKIESVAISSGPGSYTSLRIASSTAKGVCYGRNIPLIALPTTAVMSVPLLLHEDLPEECLLCPMIDARRDEVYATLYDRALNTISPTSAIVVTEESFAEILEKQPICFFGSGAEKCKQLITHSNAIFADKYKAAHARWMMPLAERAFLDERFEDIAYFEPFYLKEFIATKPKKLL